MVDSNSVYVFADSADLDGRTFSGTPDEFAAAFDGLIGVHGRCYELLSHDPRDGRGGYDVYRVDDGVVLGVIGGQDQEDESPRLNEIANTWVLLPGPAWTIRDHRISSYFAGNFSHKPITEYQASAVRAPAIFGASRGSFHLTGVFNGKLQPDHEQ